MKDFDLRQGDVRLRGCGFTLYPASKEANTDKDLMHTLLWAAEEKFKTEAIPEEREKREKWPLTYTKAEIENTCLPTTVATLIDAGLITKTGEDEFTLTEKSIKIFLRAKEIDEQLSKENFYHCPCHMYC